MQGADAVVATAAAVAGALACGLASGVGLGRASAEASAAALSELVAAVAIAEEILDTNIRVVEPTATHEVTIILLPGFTGSGERLVTWFKRLEEFGVSLDSVQIVATTAPVRPISCYDGWRAPGWFDYIDEQFDTEDIIDESQLKQSREILTKLVDAEVEKLGGDASKVLLLGFSQGGNMAYDVALSYPQQLAGLIARRTSLRNESALGPHKRLPIVHFHGEDDDGIGWDRGKAGVARLQAAGELLH